MPMKLSSKVMKVGNSLVMVLPKSICDNYKLEKGSTIDILTTDSGLFIPVKQIESTFVKEELEKALKSIVSRSGKPTKA